MRRAKARATLAADIAAVLTERGLGGDDVDLTHRRGEFPPRPLAPRERRARHGEALERARELAPQTPAAPSPVCGGGRGRGSPIGALLSLAYPDRIAKNRGNGSFTLANGRGGNVDAASPLSREPFIAVAELTGSAAQGRIVLAAPIALAEIEQRFADRIESRDEVTFDENSMQLARAALAQARRHRACRTDPQGRAGRRRPRACSPKASRAPGSASFWTKALTQWRDRVMFLRRSEGDEWPDLSDAALAADVDWLVPALAGKTALSQLAPDDLHAALTELLPWPLRRRLDAEAPTHFEAPTGTNAAIDYEAEAGPTISIRLQELFGLAAHPTIAGGRIPLVIELLSPAHRPVQVTRDLPGFWRGSYAAVRSDMRGRYPRHPWPDDPLAAAPTRRAKPRGT